MDLQGSIPPMVTPIREETGDVNTEVLRTHTRFLVNGGASGLFPCGSTGEFSSLTRRQRKRVIGTVVEEADDVPVLAGCGDTSVRRVNHLIADASQAGADAAVVVTPYYLETSQESLQTFFRTIADQSPIPVLLYEIPSLTGHHLTVDSVVRLAEHDNIISVKASIEDVVQYFEMVRETPPSFDVFTGLPELTLPVLEMGGSGVIAGPANVYPGVMTQIVDSYRDHEYGRAGELLNAVLMPILSAIRSMPTVPALKYMLTLNAFDMGPPLSPMPELEGPQRERLGRLCASIERSSLTTVDR